MGVRLVVHNFLADEMNYTGTHNHDETIHRDWVDQHPIYAITGLQEVLNTIETNLVDLTILLNRDKEELTNLIKTTEQHAKTYTDDQIHIVNDTILTLNVVDKIVDSDTVDLDYNKNDNSLRADVKIYDDPNDSNSLVKTSEGLYVPKVVPRETTSITWDEISYGETLNELFQNGIRFSHQGVANNNLYNPSEANAWYWDKDLQSFVQPQNAASYNGFVTNSFYDYYTHSVRLVSTDGDDNINGVIIGFVFDEYNNPHTLSALIQRTGNIIYNFRFAIVYDFYLPTSELIKQYTLSNSNGGWHSVPNGISLLITKNKNLITVSSTSWNYVNNNNNLQDAENMSFEATLTIDLNQYQWGFLFKNKVRYGYSNLSQAKSYFDHVFFESKTARDTAYISCNIKPDPNINNAVELREDGLFVQRFNISEESDNGLTLKPDGYYVKSFPMHISNQIFNGLEDKGDGNYYVHQSHSFIRVTQTNHEFQVGKFIYYDVLGEKYVYAVAKDGIEINIVGMVSHIYNNNEFEYVCSGFIATNLFDTEHGFTQGVPIYISDKEAGDVTQEQPDISKTVGYPIENKGLIISIERGIQYNQEAQIGDFKISANNYSVRSDGFIKVAQNIDYKISLVNKLVSGHSVTRYIDINQTTNTMTFNTNITELYESQYVPEGMNLFIKAF